MLMINQINHKLTYKRLIKAARWAREFLNGKAYVEIAKEEQRVPATVQQLVAGGLPQILDLYEKKHNVRLPFQSCYKNALRGNRDFLLKVINEFEEELKNAGN